MTMLLAKFMGGNGLASALCETFTADFIDDLSDLPLAVYWIVGVIVALLIIITVVVFFYLRSQRIKVVNQLYCKGCGRKLDPGEVCPDCGPDAGTFKNPQA